MKTGRIAVVLCAVIVLVAGGVRAEEKAPAVELGALARMPVKEVTVFKDGHAFVLHQGQMPTDPGGNVVMDYLPTPVMGTFWPYSADKDAELTSVVAGRRRVLIKRTALTVRELLEANVGAEAFITENGVKYFAIIAGIPERSSQELEATSPPNSGDLLPAKGNIILLKTDSGTRAVDISRIQDVAFKGAFEARLANEEFRDLLTLKLDWKQGKPAKTANVGLVYVQKGIRWIPNYKVEVDGKGKAVVKLQATLLNELTDLTDVTAHLVIGVPTFAFKDTVDPIALQQTVAALSQHFRQDAQTAYALSNAIMSQSARMADERGAAPEARPPQPNLGPEIASSGKDEDLFVFTVNHVTLRKGERMVLPVAEYSLDYKDVYALDLPFAPPTEIRRGFDSNRQAELARLFHAPKVMHNIRLANKSKYPLTTAPALIFHAGRILGQGLMTYTAIGGSTDLEITAAVDVQVKKSEKETKRTPNVVQWGGNNYGRIDLAGTVSLTNHLTKAIDLEVTRHLLGEIDSADNDGVMHKGYALDDLSSFGGYPQWWGWYNWPYWWGHLNGVSRATWKLTLEPGKSVELGYAWHYFWPW